MKILIGTDLLLSYLNRTDYMEGIMILFRWLERLKYKKYIDFGSVVVLTHFVELNEFRNLKGFEVLKKVTPKNFIIRIIENQINSVNVRNSKNIKTQLMQLNYLLEGDVDYIITEDKDIHDVARQLSIDDKVYAIEDFLEKCVAEHRELDETKGIALRTVKFGSLSLNDPFFNTFINEYAPYYYEWFKKKATDDVYVAQDLDGNIRALLKLKLEGVDEDYSDISPKFKPATRLKICSLKADYTSNKLGQRMIKIIFEIALKYNVDEIYITIFNNSPQRKRLIGMIQGWGFQNVAVKGEKELVFVRSMKKQLTDNPCTYYPYQDGNAQSFIISLRKEYASILLPSIEHRNNMDDIEPYKSAIRKVLVIGETHANLTSGDSLLFYQKSDKIKECGIIAAGVVERVYHSFINEKDFHTRCRKRSFLSDETLEKYWLKYNKKPIVIEFLFTYSFKDDFIAQSRLNDLEITGLNNKQVFQLSQNEFKELIKGSHYEKNIITN